MYPIRYGRHGSVWRFRSAQRPEGAFIDMDQVKGTLPDDKREYDIIYVNGDNNLQNLKTDTESSKVRRIETEFKAQMFKEK